MSDLSISLTLDGGASVRDRVQSDDLYSQWLEQFANAGGVVLVIGDGERDEVERLRAADDLGHRVHAELKGGVAEDARATEQQEIRGHGSILQRTAAR